MSDIQGIFKEGIIDQIEGEPRGVDKSKFVVNHERQQIKKIKHNYISKMTNDL